MVWPFSFSLVMLLLQLLELIGVLMMGWLMMPTMRLMWYMKRKHLEFDAESYLQMITRKREK